MQDRKISHKVVEFQGAEIGYRTLKQCESFDAAHAYVSEYLGPIVHWDIDKDFHECADYFLKSGRLVAVEAYDRQPYCKVAD